MTSRALPELLEVRHETPLKVRLRLRLPRDLIYFQGHFPAAAILPAVAQIDWAMQYGVEFLGVAGTFRGMDRLKFWRVLAPADEPELTLELMPQKNTLEFAYSTRSGRHSAGQLWIS
jgi:3-hydroxymyristoyl/3-hydroxydecanoyl-(acyl carrier protein) dehydratase